MRDLYAWILDLLDTVPHRPAFVGINGPQGSGKSTLASRLVATAAAEGRRWFALSIDDFYRTRAELRALAAAHPADPILAVRGAPGTHDVALGTRTLDALRGSQGDLAVPTYDKAAHEGKGDRRPPEQWRTTTLPLDVVLLEGWILGFPALGGRRTDPRLRNVHAALPAYEAWTRRLDGMIQLRMVDPTSVVAWRTEAEAKLRAEGRGAMTDAEAEAYVRRFLPLYAVYPDALADRPPVPAWHRVLWLDRARRPVPA